MEMPKLTEGHRKLETLVGTWEGTETMHPSQWDPNGGTATGRTTSRLAVGGFAVITDYEQVRDGAVTFSGHGIYTFDPNEGRYSLYWVDSMGSPPEVFTGGFSGNVLTLGHEGPPMHVRLTWDFSNAGRLVSRMEMSEDGNAWKTLFDAEYARK